MLFFKVKIVKPWNGLFCYQLVLIVNRLSLTTLFKKEEKGEEGGGG